jgi:transcriptional regulator with XRE-family HTH domain
MSTPAGRARCPDCGAQLRRGRAPGQRCDPCQRSGPRRILLAEGFYDQPSLETALAGFEFGPVFRAVRAVQHWSQQTLGEFLDMEQGRISDIENGKRPLLDLRVVVPVANKLGIPAGKLGFAHGVTVGRRTSTGRKGSWVQRRDFVERVAGLALGLSGVVGLDLDRLIALMPPTEPTGTRHLGAADVETIEQATTAYIRQDFATGAGPVRDLAVTHLRSVLPLLGAHTSPEVRPRLLVATARLATQAGYLNYDVKQHDAARRLWMIGLDLARAADHPQGSDLTVFVLYDMAAQAVHLGRPDEALRLVHLGHAVAAAGVHPVSAATTSCLASIQARAHAAQGNTAGCDRALGQAVERSSTTDPAGDEAWAAKLVDETHLASFSGAAHYTLALHNQDSHAASRAVPLLRHAVDNFGPSYARARALNLPELAGAHAIAGDTDTAVTVGHQAIDAITALHSPRAYDRLRVLHSALEPLHTNPGVAELRERLLGTAA